MSARHCLALALALALPTLAAAQAFEYAPGTVQYRITSRTTGSQEAMGQKQEFETSSRQLVTVNVSRAHRDTLNVVATLDSISVVGIMGVTPPGLDKLIGTKVSSKLSPSGAVYAAEGPSDADVPNAAQITDEMSRLLPRVRGALVTGATWTDTTTGKMKQGGLEIDRRVVSTFKVTGDTTISGERAWKIARDAVTSMQGSGVTQGQPVTLEGKSDGKGSVLVSPAGTFIGMRNEESANIRVILAANGMELAIVQNATTTIEKVR